MLKRILLIVVLFFLDCFFLGLFDGFSMFQFAFVLGFNLLITFVIKKLFGGTKHE